VLSKDTSSIILNEGASDDMGASTGGYSGSFALIVVLFILLIIVGTAYVY
jgi:uncharacterized protein (TIGR01732 family)